MAQETSILSLLKINDKRQTANNVNNNVSTFKYKNDIDAFDEFDTNKNIQKLNDEPQEHDFMSDLFGGNTDNGNVIELTQQRAKLAKLLLSPSGILYEDDNVQIGVRSQIEIPGGIMKVLLYYGNKTSSTVSIQSTTIINTSDCSGAEINFHPKSFDILSKKQTQQQCKISLNAPCTSLPKLQFKFTVNSQKYSLLCQIPVIASKFFKPHVFEPQQFKQRWSQLKNESKQIIRNISSDYDVNKIREILSNGMNMGLIDGVNEYPNESISCSVYHFAKKNNNGSYVTMPILSRIKYNRNNNDMRVTVRSPHPSTTQSVMTCFLAIFEQ